MAGNVSGIHQFADDVGPNPLKWLDDSYDTLTTALNTLSTFSNFYTDTGTTNNLTINTTQHQLVSYTDGLEVLVRVAATNTGAATLNVNGLGAQPILTSIGSELQPNALVAGSIVTFVYNAQRTAWQIASGGGGGQITMPFMVTNAQGEAAFAIFPDGSGTLGSPGPCGLDWDANCNFWFSDGAGIRSMFAPFTINDASGNPLFNIAADGSGSISEGAGDCKFSWGDYTLLGGIADACFVFQSSFTTWPTPGLKPWLIAFSAQAGTHGPYVFAGSTGDDVSFQVMPLWGATSTGGYPTFQLNGDGTGFIGAPVADGIGNYLKWDAAGHFTLTGTATLPMPPLIDLPGINITNPQNGEALVYDAANNQWVNGAPVNALATLNDVALTGTPFNGQSLVYNGLTQRWVNSAPVLALEGLTNAHVSGPAPGQVLTYSMNPSPGWVNATIPGYNFLTSLGVGPAPQAGWVLTWDGLAWVGAAPGEVAQFPLSSLTDVGITTPLNRQVLTYDAPNAKWINAPAPSPSLATLPDVALTSQTQGQVLAWNATANRWENSALPGGSVIALDTLMDTNISDPQNNQVLTWDYASARWVNRSPVTNLSALSDVTLTSPASGQVLSYTGTHWINTTPVSVTVSATAPANPQSGWLWWDTVGGQLYVWFPNQWVMANSANLPPQTLVGLSDVALSTPTNGQMLVYNGTVWANSSTVRIPFSVNDAAGTTNLLAVDQVSTLQVGPFVGGWATLRIPTAPGGTLPNVEIGPRTTSYPMSNMGCRINGNTQLCGNSTGANAGLTIYAGTTDNDTSLWVGPVNGGYSYFSVYSGGEVGFPNIANKPTVAGTQAVIYGAVNAIRMSSSSAHFKRDVQTLARSRARETVEKLRAITFRSKCEGDDPTLTYYGLLAEEVAEVDPRLVTYRDGQPFSVAYDRIAMLLLPLVQELLGMDEPEGEVYG